MASIRFENADLEYPIRENQVTFKEYLIKGLFRKTLTKKRTMVQALKNVSFTIRDGERVGFIGNNGAGKSTLLRSIAGIYPIARGVCDVQGDICSLFDISVGFETEATGWKNIYFRSYLQGATPAEVRSRLREIGEFTELGDFMDLPLRCYSSGMLIRLAFAIATATDPEILLVDEFFQAGDLVFQKKAEKRMKALINKANIVIMVGHNLEYFKENCDRILWLHQGSIRMDGRPAEVIPAYLGEVDNQRKKQAA